ncbi:MAG TPA: hypothetical protein DCQ26_06140 [Marinilabiliales bacterium]|jgi:hypothetical protein|nr:DUF4924 family protein [Salinivirgaceae bacterium]OFX41260.1 MAG: hypothetical protein A2W95_02070 [Bacteroidetes bacterium GWA2_40_14]OFX61949.1 MAG: hypothetical protein A2W84_13255 [Bacteroidetes bacterium GWC2_40_13]OFX74096.1 MAG: hypothetical protein A2W96_12365 [Bacteroidetes bacterium GWD2_40_43]OFX93070.1 MAG: hypothetical protein A2W97_05710 [Bacteroidetes bacterium GWE2_40_63]OFY21440.1 MAG: hypothetical protein A2W88_09710 [Bacteroidetes bacterium GWF2_40_13]OFZ25138.1 MAG: hyp
MLIAKKKRKENIGEYLLYMFQIEDLLRACQFNPQLIEERLITQYQTDETTKFEIRNWYLGLAELMEEEKLQTNGHLSFIQNIFTEVFDFHLYLLSHEDYADYQLSYKKIASLVKQLKDNSRNQHKNEIELMVTLIYTLFVTKLKNKEVPGQMQQMVVKLSGLLAQLSKKFSDYELGLLKIE